MYMTTSLSWSLRFPFKSSIKVCRSQTRLAGCLTTAVGHLILAEFQQQVHCRRVLEVSMEPHDVGMVERLVDSNLSHQLTVHQPVSQPANQTSTQSSVVTFALARALLRELF